MTGRELPQNWVQAYADDTLTPAQRATAETQLASDPALAEHARALAAENAAIRAAVPDPDAAQLAMLAARAEADGRSWGMPLRAAALIGALAVGLGGGWFAASQSYAREIAASQSDSERLVATATDAHRLYSVEVLHPVEVTAAERDHLNGWLSNRLGAPIAAPRLEDSGFSLVGGRLLPGLGGPAAQFMYEDGSGERITLFVAPAGHSPATALRFEKEGELTTASWADPHWRYALVGGLSRDKMEALARQMHRDMI